MRQASQQFNEEHRRRINEAVVQAESKTSAEIVPVVATASGRYDRAEDVIGLWLSVAGLVVAAILMPYPQVEAGAWGGLSVALYVAVLAAAVVAGFIAGAIIGTYWHTLRRLFTPRAQMREEVSARARAAFFDSSIHKTAAGTGLLVYVSLYERRASVLADRAVLDKLGQDALDALCRQLTESLTKGDITAAICGVIDSAGEQLGKVLPRADDDVNELPDELVTLD
ncbi:MAG TPA: hypothetical protein VNA25_02805 [Phycisphaerae bacterium]|nr:hypothetical protein [Phycisphaerae bacterium]HUT56787.1 hypothetical protein [Phycisphaerae bacterium]